MTNPYNVNQRYSDQKEETANNLVGFAIVGTAIAGRERRRL